MLKVEMTPNLLGFRISGDYDDLNELYDAVWELTIADDDFLDDKRMRGNEAEQIMSRRLLALCYDLRHAYQGSRSIELVDSGMSEQDAEYHGVPFVRSNVVFSVNVLYPEALYEALALNYLIWKRANKLLGHSALRISYDEGEKTLFDGPTCTVRSYVSKLVEAVGEVASPGRLVRIRKNLADGYFLVAGLYQQWVDVINEDYVGMSRKQRAESLSTVVRDLAEYHLNEQYLEMAMDIDRVAKENGISRDYVRIPGLYEWDEPEW